MSSPPDTLEAHDDMAELTMRNASQIGLLHGLVAIQSLSGEEDNAVSYLVADGFIASLSLVPDNIFFSESFYFDYWFSHE